LEKNDDSLESSQKFSFKKWVIVLQTPMRRRSGITVLELLIGVTTVTALTSFVMPAILASRESSSDRQCTERLQQIGVALKQFAEKHGSLPAGWTLDASRSWGQGWAAILLPELGEERLSSPIPMRPNLNIGAAALKTPEVYLCPSDFGAKDFALFAEVGEPGENAQKSTKKLLTLPRANYMGVFGISEPDEVAGDTGEGIFIEGRGMRPGDITRGLQHVFMVGERTTRKMQSTWLGFATAGEDAGGRIVGCASEGPNRDDTDECEFDSRHNGHVNFLWADGHVSGIQDGIDSHIYQLSSRRN
jgi:prepilin-type processing-associated H-X9-DG protein